MGSVLGWSSIHVLLKSVQCFLCDPADKPTSQERRVKTSPPIYLCEFDMIKPFNCFCVFVFCLSQLRNLNVLDLRHISELNNETVMEVVRKCRNLSSLNLCLNWSINDRYVKPTIVCLYGRSTQSNISTKTDTLLMQVCRRWEKERYT